MHEYILLITQVGKHSTPFTGSPWITTPLLYVVTEAKKTWCVFPSCCAHQVRSQRNPQPVIRYLRILGREDVASRSPGENTHKNLRQFFLGGPCCRGTRIPSSKHPSAFRHLQKSVAWHLRDLFFATFVGVNNGRLW